MFFSTTLESMLHASAHAPHYIEREHRRRRRVSCWRCAKEMNVPEGDAPYSCECGFVLPPKAQFQELPDAEG